MGFKPGDRLGEYVVIGRLGAGGMGEVYKVRHELTERVEAMKTLLPKLMANTAAVERFKREIQLLAGLHHKNIAELYSAQVIGGQLLMIMEFVEGINLHERLQQPPLSLDEGISYILQTLNALQYAHSLPKPVIHRDIKPENLMIARDGIVKVMDFGIAKVVGNFNLTQAGTRIGSVRYMSPEQANGDIENLDQRSDLYSVGVVLYEIVTGSRPFEYPSEYKIMAAHISEPPVPPVQYVPGLSPDLNSVVLKALAKKPDRRFQSAQEFIGAIENCAISPAFVERPKTVEEHFVPSGAQPSRSQRAHAARLFAFVNQRTLYILLGAVLAFAAAFTLTLVGLRIWNTIASGSSTVQSQPSGNIVGNTQPAQPPGTVTGSAANHAGGGGQDTNNAGNIPKSVVSTNNIIPQTPANPQNGNWWSKYLPGKTASGSATNPPAGGNQQVAGQTGQRTHSNQDTGGTDHQADTGPKKSITNHNVQDDSQRQQLLLDLQTRFVDLKIRADTLNNSWGAMQDQLKNDGLDLRQDISQSLARMNSYRDLSEQSLHSGDAVAAKHYMDLMEVEIKNLEKTGR